MNIAVLVCSNGLGHTRRVIAIAEFMFKNGFEGQLHAFMPKMYLDKLKFWDSCRYFTNHPNIKISDFHYPRQSIEKTNDLYAKDWHLIELPNLELYDKVWSDNILQVLEIRPDTKITGSFLWHEVFDNNNNTNGLNEFIQSQKRILNEYKPQMAGNEYFATPDVKLKTDFFPVGLYRYSGLLKEKTGKGVLIACGLGGEEEEITRSTVMEIIRNNMRPTEKLFVESRLLPPQYPEWIEKANFSAEMFHECAAVCIRPGMGTLSDALVNHTRVFAFSNQQSFEMVHNSKVLEGMKVGEKCQNPMTAYQKAIEFVSSEENIKNQILKTLHLRTDGVYATVNFLLKK
jgi:hypothetical protein